VCPPALSVRLQAWRLTSPPPPLACTLPPTVRVSAVSMINPPPTVVPLLSALICPGTVATASALRKTVPLPHESLLTSIGALDRATLLVPGTPRVALPPQLLNPLPGRLSGALTVRSPPVGSMSTVPPPPPPVPPGRVTGASTVTEPLLVKLSSSPPSPPPSLEL